MRIPTGIKIDYRVDRKGYMKAYYAQNRDRLLADTKKRGADWRAENGDYKRARSRAVNAHAKHHIIFMLGGKCATCGFDDPRALQVDHVNGCQVAWKRRAEAKEMGMLLYRRLLNGEADRSNYQILCANCNWIKRHERQECRRKPS